MVRTFLSRHFTRKALAFTLPPLCIVGPPLLNMMTFHLTYIIWRSKWLNNTCLTRLGCSCSSPSPPTLTSAARVSMFSHFLLKLTRVEYFFSDPKNGNTWTLMIVALQHVSRSSRSTVVGFMQTASYLIRCPLHCRLKDVSIKVNC